MQTKILNGTKGKFVFFPNEEETVISISNNAIVYIGADSESGEKVIIKKISTANFNNDVNRFKFFADVCTLLHHINIVKIYDMVFEGADIYLICEFVNGRTLKELICDPMFLDYRNNKFFLKIILECLNTLDFIHKNKLCHCNLKPENIIVEWDECEEFNYANPKIKILSIENIKLAFKEMSVKRNLSRNILYYSPEQILGFDDLVGDYSDIFSMGLILYEVLAKEPALKIDNPMALQRLQIFGKIEQHYRINEEIYEIIEKATVKPGAFNPASTDIDTQKLLIIKALNLRYQSVEKFKTDINNIIEEL